MTQQDAISSHAHEPNKVPPALAVLEMLNGMRVSRAIQVAAEFRLPDLLAAGPKSVGELAIATGTNEDSLYRLMRALASVAIFSEVEPGYFSLTPLSNALRSDLPGTLYDMTLMHGDEWFWRSIEGLADSVRTGSPAVDLIYGVDMWEYLTNVRPASGQLFNRAMTSFSDSVNVPIARTYDFAAARRIIDVGGGQGSLLSTILRQYPSARGVLFDRPAVIETAREKVESELRDRLDLVAGDFFTSVPEGGDMYILKQVTHDWSDEQCVQILKNCRQAIASNGRVLIMERLVIPGGGKETAFAKFLDLQMMVQLPGKERTEAEFAALYEASGFKLTRVISTHSPTSLIEGVVA